MEAKRSPTLAIAYWLNGSFFLFFEKILIENIILDVYAYCIYNKVVIQIFEWLFTKLWALRNYVHLK